MTVLPDSCERCGRPVAKIEKIASKIEIATVDLQAGTREILNRRVDLSGLVKGVVVGRFERGVCLSTAVVEEVSDENKLVVIEDGVKQSWMAWRACIISL